MHHRITLLGQGVGIIGKAAAGADPACRDAELVKVEAGRYGPDQLCLTLRPVSNQCGVDDTCRIAGIGDFRIGIGGCCVEIEYTALVIGFKLEALGVIFPDLAGRRSDRDVRFLGLRQEQGSVEVEISRTKCQILCLEADFILLHRVDIGTFSASQQCAARVAHAEIERTVEVERCAARCTTKDREIVVDQIVCTQ